METDLIPARIDDLKSICHKTNSPKFLGFLTLEETAIAARQLEETDNYCLFGGYDGAERVVLGVLPQWCDEPRFPISAVTFTYRDCDTLSHRDFLGALMSLGIIRETVGDILVEKGRAVVFVMDDVLKFVLTQIQKVGNVGVTLTSGYAEPLPQMSQKKPFSVTVASLRLDCVVSGICGVSRNQATEKIKDGLVAINSVCATKATANIKPQDKITIRKCGKFEIISCDEFSKKGRIVLKYYKYF